MRRGAYVIMPYLKSDITISTIGKIGRRVIYNLDEFLQYNHHQKKLQRRKHSKKFQETQTKLTKKEK